MSAAPEPPSANPTRVWSQLLPELAEKIVSYLHPHEVPGFRLVSTAAAAQFCAPHHTTIRLSEPVPPHVFAAHWLAPGATRGLTRRRRQQLLRLTAASGVVANLEVAGCLPTDCVLETAAGAGQLDACVWLWEHGCQEMSYYTECSDLLARAARRGHRHVCEWLITLGLSWQCDGAADAGSGGHVGLMKWLLARGPELHVTTSRLDDVLHLVMGVAHGCDLPTLQRMWGGWGQLGSWVKSQALAVAVGSRTPDWMGRQEPECARTAADQGHLHVLAWLVETFGAEAVGMSPRIFNAVARTGSVEMMAWLLERGCGWDGCTFTSATCSGCEEAVEWLVAQGCPVQGDGDPYASACRCGDLAMARLLRRLGVPWGPAGSVFSSAAEQALLPLLRWLLEEGYPVGDYDVARRAAEGRDSGRSEALELLAAHRQAQEGEEVAEAAAPAGGLAV
ncbi:hypothetical protein GPECTOR_22g934 [Gonium pectorale]|uniref:Ankyrin repeat domain-containing protein n=1 Tax=Gonium pectorale TaxID=33097 RepID=A0A150GIV6_GONPE|nr:hypothetical protein GPECTOR_22g934 [Gonium pectorale]|eukprot:KXZ49340.1 hypothetical protein GPECTOR_22g934 [Gonium pectorale]